MSMRLLVAGSVHWTDGDAVRAGLRWALDRYGGDGSTLIIAGACDRGACAIAQRAWSEMPGVNPDVEHMSGWLGDGEVTLETNLRDARPDVTLLFQVLARNQRGKLPRAVSRVSRRLGVPTWRWSVRQRQIVAAGTDAHAGHGARGVPRHLDTDYDH